MSMSKLIQKLSLVPKWGSDLGSSITNFIESQHFKERLLAIGRKKLANPKVDVSKEIKDLLEENKQK